MIRISSVGALAALLAAGFAAPASAQTFQACRVPAVGVIYMINVGDAPTACLDASHVQFTWTEGGAPGPNSVTSAMIVDGTITATDIAADAIGAAQLAATAVTTTDLGSGTAGASTFLRGDRSWASVSPVVTQFIFGGSGPAGSATFTPTLYRSVGNFTKVSATSAVYVSWTATVNNASTTGGFCQFQVRVDDLPPTGNVSSEYGGGIYANHQVITFRGRWTGLSTGAHSVSIFLRGSTGNTCSEGFSGFDSEVLVEEVP